MQDTDWRPSPCPLCGEMREAARTPLCSNVSCDCYVERPRTMKTEQKYLWENDNGELRIISDLSLLFKNPDFDAYNDQIFELGPEVKLKMQIVAIPAQRLTRDHSWENKE
jgi:hypothetical protein